MLYVPPYSLLPLADNFGATYTDAGLGTAGNNSGVANTKGTTTTLIAASSVTRDVAGIGITFNGGSVATGTRRYFADIMVDSRGGTSWDVKIPNLFVNNPSLVLGGYQYYFPLYIKAGSSVGFRYQGINANTLRCSVQLFAMPDHPESIKVGTFVEAFGVDTSTTSGTAITPGTSLMGAYTQMGTSTRKLWWWQWGGVGYNEGVFVVGAMLGDIGIGTASDQRLCMKHCLQRYNGNEEAGKCMMGINIPYLDGPNNSAVWVRAACVGTPETTPTTTAYGMG